MTRLTIIALTALALCSCSQGEIASPDANQTAKAGAHDHASAPVSAEQTSFVITEDMYPLPAKQPNFGPRAGSITFTDTDPGPTIGGTIQMDRAVNNNGQLLSETDEGISTYMIHWGLEVGAPGIEDDTGQGDHGGDCRGFRDTGHVVMARAETIGDAETLSWEIPQGTQVPEGAVYFVGHTLYGEVHNLGKCTQTAIHNLIE